MSSRRTILLVFLPADGQARDEASPEYYKSNDVVYMPLGVASVAGGLLDSPHEVQILDANARGLTVEETIREINARDPEILGISAVTYRAWAMTELLRRCRAPLKIVGGPHTIHHAELIRQQGAHAVFVGDGEESLLQWINQGCPQGVYTQWSQDLDRYHLPARHLLELDLYRIKGDRSRLLYDLGDSRFHVMSSKGCPFHCNFCNLQQKKVASKSPARVIEEMRQLIALKATSVYFIDDYFNFDKRRLKEICRLFRDSGLGIHWSVRMRVETREDVIAALAEAGCNMVHFGFEHLDDDILDYYRKGYRYKHIEQCCRLCERYGMKVVGFFVIGAPMETAEQRRTLLQRALDIHIHYPYFNRLTPLHDSEYYQELLAKGVFRQDFWKAFIENPTPNFLIPSGRTPEQDLELQETLQQYTQTLGALRERERGAGQQFRAASCPPSAP